jgi:hypothetical protein
MNINAKENAKKAGGVLVGFITASLVKKLLPKFATVGNIVAGGALLVVSKNDIIQSAGAAHVAVGLADGIKTFLPTVPYVPTLSGMRGMRGLASPESARVMSLGMPMANYAAPVESANSYLSI